MSGISDDERLARWDDGLFTSAHRRPHVFNPGHRGLSAYARLSLAAEHELPETTSTARKRDRVVQVRQRFGGRKGRCSMRLVFGTVLVLAVVAMGTYMLGYWSFNQVTVGPSRSATPAAAPSSTSTARDRMGQLDAQAGKAAQEVGDFMSDAGLTAKIKAKMALDDSVRARTIDVSTTDGVVTLAGTVGSAAEHDRAVQLARDTKGIKRVVDHLNVLLP
jgi:hyperosmotically inducible protein